MNLQSTSIGLPADFLTLYWEPKDWSLLRMSWAAHHHPSHCIFAFEMRRGWKCHQLVRPSDYRARLTHVCPGHPVPSHAAQINLGRAALLFMTTAAGLIPPVRCDQDDAEDGDDVPF